MSPIERLRDLLPFAVALYLAGSVAQLQATQATFHPHRGSVTIDGLVSGIKWHMLEMARNEQAEMLVAIPGE